MEARGGLPAEIDAPLADMLAAAYSVFPASAGAAGQSCLHHRGGPAGFLRVLGPSRIGFADHAGSGQYVTETNLSEKPSAQPFVMDFARARRVKIWGRATVTEDAETVAALGLDGQAVGATRAVLLAVEAWDVNCKKNYPTALRGGGRRRIPRPPRCADR